MFEQNVRTGHPRRTCPDGTVNCLDEKRALATNLPPVTLLPVSGGPDPRSFRLSERPRSLKMSLGRHTKVASGTLQPPDIIHFSKYPVPNHRPAAPSGEARAVDKPVGGRSLALPLALARSRLDRLFRYRSGAALEFAAATIGSPCGHKRRCRAATNSSRRLKRNR